MKLSLFIPEDGKLCKVWYLLFIGNFFVMTFFRYVNFDMPVSLLVEVLYFVCIIGVLTNKDYKGNVGRWKCAMLGIYMPWLLYAILEVGNMSSEIGFGTIASRWFAEIRTMGFQVLYGMVVCAAIFTKKEQLKTMYKIWGVCVIICTAKTLMQQFVGFDAAENAFLAVARKTHFVNGIIRYFSLFSDAANYGCNMAATTALFGAVALSCRLKKEKVFFGIVTFCAFYGMMASGTRTGIFVVGVGGIVYALLSKRITALVTTCIVGGAFFAFLAFTNIGQGNNMIRRMRSAFSSDDASMSVREMNQQAMKSYIDELPLGLGAGIRGGDVPQSNKNYFLSIVPPDSTWVYVNIHYGHIGKFLFLLSFLGMCFYAGYIVFFKIRDPELSGLLAAITSGATAMVAAGYANQIQLQYPNCFLFFGQLMLVYLGPDIDRRIQEEQAEKDRKLLLEGGEMADATEVANA